MVLVGQAAHTLAEDLTWRGTATFAVVFGLIWIAWLNGTLFYELHGREDGHTRSLIFVQMLLLALMAVYVGHADGDDGRTLAALYALLLGLLSYQWYSVYRQDPPELRRTPRRYLIVMAAGIVLIAAPVPLSADARLAVWAVFVIVWCGVEYVILISWRRGPSYDVVTDPMVERFGLFIIVLGEVVIGVVNGLTDTERSALVTTTGLLGLTIGFGSWWNYADLVSRRMPRETGHSLATWIFAHLPMTMAVAAAGAGMVGLVEHATDHRTPVAVSWLMGGAVAAMLVTIVVLLPTLADYDRHPSAFRSVQAVLVMAAVVALLAGWFRPAPWLLALVLLLLLFATWTFAFVRWLREGSPINERPTE